MRRLERVCKILIGLGPNPADVAKIVESINMQDGEETKEDSNSPSKRQLKNVSTIISDA